MTTAQNEKKSYVIHAIIIVLLVANLVVNVFSLKTAEDIEIMKVGGIENYDTLKTIMGSDAYKEQYTQNLKLMLQQIQGGNLEEFGNTEQPEESGMTEEFTGTEVDLNQAQADNL